MRLLGLDIGERRVGVAVSDPTGRVATPLKVLPAPLSANVRALMSIIDDYEPELIVIGLPLSMDGSEGPQARRIREEGARLAGMLPVGLTYHDERLSSVAAQRAMADAGADSRARRGSVDMVAAAIMLQTYLDANQERPND
ncbi:MAG: Holliday junction resolvase RuvX [Coriobacteriia bacterium]